MTLVQASEGKEYVMDCNLGKNTKAAYKPGDAFEMVYPSVLKSSTTSFALDQLGAYEARIWKRR